MLTSPRDWSEPFLEQAREDLQAAWAVNTAGVSPSTLCMLLQMVFEKLAKAAIARQGLAVPQKHGVAKRLFSLLNRHPSGIKLLQTSPNVESFISQLEDAHPALAGKQNPVWAQLEYPWEDTMGGRVCCPARDLSLVKRISDPKDRIAVDCLRFANALEKQLSVIVP